MNDFRPRFDFHIHSSNSHDVDPGTSLATIRDQIRENGIRQFGISDHLNNPATDAHLRASRKEYNELDEREGFLFGTEVSTLREWDLEVNAELGEDATPYGHSEGGPKEPPQVYLPDELYEELRFDYIIGGAHWPLGVDVDSTEALVRDWHEQQLCIVQHPRVDVLVHPWWWCTVNVDLFVVIPMPWLTDFSVIPRSMHEELAAACVEHDTAVEFNACSFFEKWKDKPEPPREQYLELFYILQDAGVRFSIGSDSHGPGYDNSNILKLHEPLAALKIAETDLWKPSPIAENVR